MRYTWFGTCCVRNQGKKSCHTSTCNIEDNEQIDKLVEEGRKKEHIDAIRLYKFAHTTPHHIITKKIGGTS